MPRAVWPILLVIVALGATAANLGPALLEMGPGRALSPALSDHRALLFHYSALPRLAMGLLAGAALGLAGVLMQQVLRNPLASPTTLGVESGAQLALGVAVLFAPVLLGWSRDAVALAGALTVTGLVLAIAGRFGFRPVMVILVGVMAGLFAQSLVAVLALLRERYLSGVFLWGGGSLVQQDWREVALLWPKLTVCAVCAWGLRRPLDLLQLGEHAGAMGLRLALVRGTGLAIAAMLAGFVVSAVGMIGFLGLAAPAVARLSGARRLGRQMLVAPLAGMAMLTATDQLLQLLEAASGLMIPAGAAMAVLAAPVMLLLMRAAPPAGADRVEERQLPALRSATGTTMAGVWLACAVAVLIAVCLGRDAHGAWRLLSPEDLDALLPWRLPRTLAAAAAGAMMGVAGALLQRLSGNPMASPEVLGVSAGAGLGLLGLYWLVPAPGHGAQLAATAAGCGLVLVLLLWLERRAPGRLLQAGIALAAFLTALISAVIAMGGPHASAMLAWAAGSSAGAGAGTAVVALALAALALAVLPALSRPMELISLGPPTAMAGGVAVGRLRRLVLGHVAVLAGAATLIVGPLSFVGLIGPHAAARLGLRRVLPQTLGAAALGALLMVAADYLGRTLLFPWQLPAGIMASLVGGAAFALLGLASALRRSA